MGTDPCYPQDQALLPVAEAQAALLAQAHPLEGRETLPLAEALGRVLAEDITSPIDVPGHDNSAMDGYALHAADASAPGARLPVSQRIPAGSRPTPLDPGSAARIFTGAPIPLGADTVIMQEHTQAEAGHIVLQRAPRPGDNIRPRGNDIQAGLTVLEKGARLNPQALALIASVGHPRVEVYRRPVAAVFFTGDELAEPGQPLAPGQIYDSNRYALTALLERVGCEVLDLGRVADTLEATRAALRRANEADVILTTGGVSVGEEDHVRNAVQAEGRLQLWRVAMKPGKPFAFGQVADTPFLGLPGNPVSSLVGFMLFALPFLRRLAGRSDTETRHWPVAIDFDWNRPRPRREFVRVQVRPDQAGRAWAHAYPKQGSDVMRSTVWADGLLEIPDGQAFQRGDTLRYWSFAELLA